VGAGRALLARWEGARMLFGFVGVCADRTAGGVSAQSSGVSVGLAVVTLGAPTVCDMVFQLTLAVADDEVLAANACLFDIPCKCHDNCRVRFVFSSTGRSKLPWRLALDELGVVSGNTV